MFHRVTPSPANHISSKKKEQRVEGLEWGDREVVLLVLVELVAVWGEGCF
jgi:hypothetical protein